MANDGVFIAVASIILAGRSAGIAIAVEEIFRGQEGEEDGVDRLKQHNIYVLEHSVSLHSTSIKFNRRDCRRRRLPRARPRTIRR